MVFVPSEITQQILKERRKLMFKDRIEKMEKELILHTLSVNLFRRRSDDSVMHWDGSIVLGINDEKQYEISIRLSNIQILYTDIQIVTWEKEREKEREREREREREKSESNSSYDSDIEEECVYDQRWDRYMDSYYIKNLV